jgi:VWFA-related protein
VCAAAAKPLRGQSSAAPAQGFTLRSETRSVLTDVTVSDRNGNPVHGLPSSAFHIYDDNRPQDLASFEEHTGKEVSARPPSAVSAPGVYNNDFLLHPPPVLNVLLLDTTNMRMEDQMYLSFQLSKFLKTLRPGEQLAIYLRNGPSIVQLQGFTADHELLSAAVRKGLPHFMPPGRQYLTDADTLHQLVVYLEQLPGRKNVLWFTGGSTAFLMTDAEDLGMFTPGGITPDLHRMYDELEASRIAVYPIDARGLTVSGGSAMSAQQMLMSEEAEATGGRAFYSNNGLAQITAKVVDTDGSFYTLTYSPHNFRYDNKWHKVRVTVDGNGYQLSYRRGYFADGSNGTEQASGARNQLLPDGTAAKVEQGRSLPIIFEARVEPGPAKPVSGVAGPPDSLPVVKKGSTPLTIHYSVPADALTRKSLDGQSRVLLGVAVLAFNQNGSMIGRDAQQFTLRLNEEKLRLAPYTPVLLQQQLALGKGDAYLYLAIWDMTSGRAGTMEIPVQVPAKLKDAAPRR